MTCSHCDHFLPGAAASASEHPAGKHDRPSALGQGICRRYPPRFVADPGHEDVISLFPYVNAAHACGEFLSGRGLC